MYAKHIHMYETYFSISGSATPAIAYTIHNDIAYRK